MEEQVKLNRAERTALGNSDKKRELESAEALPFSFSLRLSTVTQTYSAGLVC